uniref:Gustatory receptor n=1 Tax=Timema monikensis TaxID=170555 RepID=A0A7R9HU85_9NEOP|nr:unnamed protein product [Timema monikensis]
MTSALAHYTTEAALAPRFLGEMNCFELTFTPYAVLRAIIMMVIPCIFSNKISQLCKAIEDSDHILAKRKIFIHSWKVHWLTWLSVAIADAIILVIAACNKRLLLPLFASQTIVIALSKNMSTITRDLYLIKYLFFCYNLKIRFDAVNDRFNVLVCQHISSSVKSMVVDVDDDAKQQTPSREKTTHCIHNSQKVVVGISNGEDKQMFRKVVYDVLTLDFIEETRLQYTILSRAVKLLNAAYGLFISAYLFLITFAFLIDLHYFFYVKENNIMDVMRSIAGNGALLVLLALFSDDLSSAVKGRDVPLVPKTSLVSPRMFVEGGDVPLVTKTSLVSPRMFVEGRDVPLVPKTSLVSPRIVCRGGSGSRGVGPLERTSFGVANSGSEDAGNILSLVYLYSPDAGNILSKDYLYSADAGNILSLVYLYSPDAGNILSTDYLYSADAGNILSLVYLYSPDAGNILSTDYLYSADAGNILSLVYLYSPDAGNILSKDYLYSPESKDYLYSADAGNILSKDYLYSADAGNILSTDYLYSADAGNILSTDYLYSADAGNILSKDYLYSPDAGNILSKDYLYSPDAGNILSLVYLYSPDAGNILSKDYLYSPDAGNILSKDYLYSADVSVDICPQVQVFTTQLMASPVQVSASGFCVVNKVTLVSVRKHAPQDTTVPVVNVIVRPMLTTGGVCCQVVMGVTMYFIILVQFSEDLKSYTDKFINMTTWDHPNLT